MTKSDCSFDQWFIELQTALEAEGVNFKDRDAVRFDYDGGMDYHDVAEEIRSEYQD